MRKTDAGVINAFRKNLPAPADVFTQPELVDISVGYMIENAQDFVYDVFQGVEVAKSDGKFRRYKPGAFLRNKMEKRADGKESKGAGFDTDTLPYTTDVWAWHTDIGPQTRANAQGSTDIEAAASELLTNTAMINREVGWMTAYFKAGVWTTQFLFAVSADSTHRLSWADDLSDPIKDMRDALRKQKPVGAGYKCNVGVMSQDVWDRILVHPKVITRFNAGQTPNGPAMLDPTVVRRQIAQLIEVQEIRVASAVYTTSTDGAAAETFDFIAPTGVAFFYVPPRPGLFTPAAGYSFNWTGYLGAGAQGQVITREVIPLTKGALRYEIEQAYAFGQVSADLGIWFDNVLATS